MKATTVLASLLACSTFNAFAVTLPPEPVARDDLFELTGLTLSISAPGILANDSGTGVIVSSFFDPGSGTLNNLLTSGAFLYTPERGFSGITTFDYSILDAYSRSSSATVTIDASTTLPQARDDYYTLSGLTLNVSAPGLLANDRGGIGEVVVASFFDPTSGTLDSVITNGSFSYTPEYGFAGVASFTYSSLDELGRNATATVFIDAAASIPVAFDDTFSVLSGGTLDILAPGLLANDRGGIGEVMVSSFFDPSSGTLASVFTDGSFRYLADPGFAGLATFQYFSIDELGRTSSALVNINVVAVPEPGTWAMMLGGLAVMTGFAGRRRRRATKH
ncbi:PEP-CTERM -sorting domain protein [Methyloversatilis sp. RAC08]|uniref:Ig-like domain-containing protein n=1 Tax=Methyloversatilis sp. RAC08 TaxID=1842540 RepID=UPI00083CF4E3|nr:Ig-like domain-containing protein [Methyloversatilis sp. RAC08]AOF81058.1 PEP-CTERM -sorting domain protein [Methyloversatilis sp. RAC08]